jgi:hypothetical protein
LNSSLRLLPTGKGADEFALQKALHGNLNVVGDPKQYRNAGLTISCQKMIHCFRKHVGDFRKGTFVALGDVLEAGSEVRCKGVAQRG